MFINLYNCLINGLLDISLNTDSKQTINESLSIYKYIIYEKVFAASLKYKLVKPTKQHFINNLTRFIKAQFDTEKKSQDKKLDRKTCSTLQQKLQWIRVCT